jgi:hypothetical protein
MNTYIFFKELHRYIFNEKCDEKIPCEDCNYEQSCFYPNCLRKYSKEHILEIIKVVYSL